MNFPAFCGWEHPWSRVNRCHLLFSCCIHFLSCLIIFALISFHFAFMSFHVPSLCIKDTGLRKLICSNPSGRYPPKRSRVFNISLSFLFLFSYSFGGMCRLPSSGFMNMYMYKLVILFFYSYRFLGRQCIGSVKVQAKLKWNARGYYTIQIAALGSGSLESHNPFSVENHTKLLPSRSKFNCFAGLVGASHAETQNGQSNGRLY